jgi:hypothetical protein
MAGFALGAQVEAGAGDATLIGRAALTHSWVSYVLHGPYWLSSTECVFDMRHARVGTPGGVRLVTSTILAIVN